MNSHTPLMRYKTKQAKKQIDVEVLKTMYANVIQNLEMTKFQRAQEEPIIEIIDEPILPLNIHQFGISQGVFLGLIFTTVIILSILILIRVFNSFDLLHAGHIKMLEECKRNCDFLIVGLQMDPSIDRPHKNKPIQSIVERYIQLKACISVDEIIPYSSELDLLEILQSYNIDIRFIGEDYLDKDFTGKEFCLEHDITIYYNSRKHKYSTSSLRMKIKSQ
jgi:glycerol-3-phosphate cytidylyltransferase